MYFSITDLLVKSLLQINQQELDEMKLKYNILLQENDSLKSQLDTMHKQSKESRKIIEKHRELKADDAAIQTDLVCGL